MLATTLLVFHLLSPYLFATARALTLNNSPSRALSTTLTVTVPLAVPSASSAPLVSALVSFSVEQDRWPEWVSLAPDFTSPNTFFLNTLDNLRQRTGQVPWIRIGADSEDHTDFNSHIDLIQTTFPAPSTTVPYPEATNITISPAYYSLARFLPPNTSVIWGLNLGQNNLSAAFLEAQALHDAFESDAVKGKGVKLEFVEIGNEADLYGGNGLRSGGSWNVGEFVKEWTTFAANVTDVAGVGTPDGPKFIGASFAGSSHSASSFSPQGAFANGLLDSAPGKLITTISQHHYSGSFCAGSEGLLQDLMTKSTVRSNLTSFAPDIAATRAKGLDYVFDETNSYSCHGAPGVSNTAGAALWTLDYTLVAARLGITRVHFHEGIGYKYNLIQPAPLTRSTLDGSPLPSPLPPHVQPQYYAALIVAEFVGPSSSSSSHITELQIDDPRLSGFAAYEDGVLRRVVLVNSEAFLSSSTAGRGSKMVNFSFDGTGAEPGSVKVRRLAIEHADDSSGLTWAGQSFETADGIPQGEVIEESVDLSSEGVVVSATEAVLVIF